MKLVHLVGFITKKFVTMHGDMNVKYKRYVTVTITVDKNRIIASSILSS
jgi:hypothetical protein